MCYIYLHKLPLENDSEAERFNGWAAMLGFVAAVGAYVTTGQIIPGCLMSNIDSKLVKKKK